MDLMKQKIATVSLIVRDYDEAIAFFTKVLRFELVEDTPLGGGKRWVLVALDPDCAARISTTPPASEYALDIAQGAKEHNLPQDYIEKYLTKRGLNGVNSNKLPDC